MDTTQTNRVTMFKTVDALLNSHNSIWSGMAPLQTAVEQFKTKIAAIDAAAQKQESPTGAALEKEVARHALEDVAFLMCEALAVLGDNDKDYNLLAVAALSPRRLRRMADEELSNRAAKVLAEAKARKADLVVLQVTEANLAELDQALRTFNEKNEKPRTAMVERAVQTESLPNLIRDANGILRNQIDRLVNLFRRSNPEFVTSYRNARPIIDRAASHSAAKTAGSPSTAKTLIQPSAARPLGFGQSSLQIFLRLRPRYARRSLA